QFLVRLAGAALQIIQGLVRKDFPPLTLRHVVERLPFFPRAQCFGFILRRRGAGRSLVIRADGATGEEKHKNEGHEGCSAIPKGLCPPARGCEERATLGSRLP